MTTVLIGAVPTIEFGEDDEPSGDCVVSGSGGCNDYRGTYTVGGESLTFGPLAATLNPLHSPIKAP